MSEFENVERQLSLKGVEKHALLVATSTLRQLFTDVHGAYPLIDFISIPPESEGLVSLSFTFSVYGDDYIGWVFVDNTDEWPKKGLVMIKKVGCEKCEENICVYPTIFGEPTHPQVSFWPPVTAPASVVSG